MEFERGTVAGFQSDMHAIEPGARQSREPVGTQPVQCPGTRVGGDPPKAGKCATKGLQDIHRLFEWTAQRVGITDKRGLERTGPCLKPLDIPLHLRRRAHREVRLAQRGVDAAEPAAVPVAPPRRPQQHASPLRRRTDNELFGTGHGDVSSITHQGNLLFRTVMRMHADRSVRSGMGAAITSGVRRLFFYVHRVRRGISHSRIPPALCTTTMTTLRTSGMRETPFSGMRGKRSHFRKDGLCDDG